MNMKLLIKFILLAGLIILSVDMFFPAITTGSDFQKIPKSARATALGESYSAAIDDIAAIDYNPAALNTMKSFGFSAMYHTWIDNSYGIYGAAGYRIGYFVIGGSFYYFNYGGIKEYDYFGNYVASYNPYDMNAKLAISADGGFLFDFLKGFSIGVCSSGIYRTLIDETIWGMTFDLGLHYKTTLAQLLQTKDDYFNETAGLMPVNFGFSIQNMGFAGEFSAPLRANIGISFGLFPDFYLSFDVTKDYVDTPVFYKIGAEYTILEILTLRVGVNIGKEAGTFACGAGIKYPFLFDNLRFDYAFAPLGVMGNNHSFSLYGEFLFGATFDDYYNKGIHYYYKQDYLKARELWRKALKINPKSIMIIRKLKALQETINFYQADKETQALTNYPYVLQLDSVKSGVSIIDNQVTFTFITKGNEVKSVSVAGDFNNWDNYSLSLYEDSESLPPYKIWKITTKMMAGIYQYRFMIDGKIYLHDVNNPVFIDDGKGKTNSILLVDYSGARMTNTFEILD